MPVVQTKRQLPVHEKFNFMALDEDGYDLPSDWCGAFRHGSTLNFNIHAFQATTTNVSEGFNKQEVRAHE